MGIIRDSINQALQDDLMERNKQEKLIRDYVFESQKEIADCLYRAVRDGRDYYLLRWFGERGHFERFCRDADISPKDPSVTCLLIEELITLLRDTEGLRVETTVSGSAVYFN
jgi:hypothetical protein